MWDCFMCSTCSVNFINFCLTRHVIKANIIIVWQSVMNGNIFISSERQSNDYMADNVWEHKQQSHTKVENALHIISMLQHFSMTIIKEILDWLSFVIIVLFCCFLLFGSFTNSFRQCLYAFQFVLALAFRKIFTYVFILDDVYLWMSHLV